MFKLVLEKAEELEIKLPTSAGSSKKQESSRKTSISAFDYAKAYDCVDHNKLWTILKEMGIPDHLTCLLRNLYAENRVHQGCILSPCLFNFYEDLQDLLEVTPKKDVFFNDAHTTAQLHSSHTLVK